MSVRNVTLRRSYDDSVSFAKKAKWCELEPPILGQLRDVSKTFSTRAAAGEDKNVRLMCFMLQSMFFTEARPANGFRRKRQARQGCLS